MSARTAVENELGGVADVGERAPVPAWRAYAGVAAVLTVFLLLRAAVVDWYVVPTGSMLPTIQIGDVVLVDRLAYDLKLPWTQRVLARQGDPARGDIAVLRSPRDGTRLVKRIVALPGDTVSLRDNVLWVNGRAAQYVVAGQGDTAVEADGQVTREIGAGLAHLVQRLPPSMRDPSADLAPTRVPSGHVLVLGDNRDASADSRVFGLVPRALLVGRVTTVLVSFEGGTPRTDRAGRVLE